jgi:plastocyanin
VQKLLDDRRRLLTVLATAAAIAVGAVLVIVVAGGSSGGGSGSAGVTTAAAQRSAGATAAGTVTIDIRDFRYLPATVTVRAGSRVRWVNDDTAPHTATAGGAFDTGTMRTGDSEVQTFGKAGSYSYVCAFHPFMKGTVVVR